MNEVTEAPAEPVIGQEEAAPEAEAPENITGDSEAESQSKADSKKKKRKKRTAKSLAIEFFIRIGITVLVIWLLLTFVFGMYVNHTNTSYPMIKDGDLCLTYKLGEPVQGDVIAYETEGGIRFGRVIGKAGDKIEIKNDFITVNGAGIFEETVYPTTPEGSTISYPYTVPEDSYFVLNDYRSDPSDSRTLGGISRSSYKGKVIFMMRRRGF